MQNNQQPVEEGYLPVAGGSLWYRLVGHQESVPLLVIHGGPGAGSAYLEGLAALADERPVVFYDQLGCGRSEKPARPTLWTLEHFVEEVAAVREYLGLEQLYLLGHSWGGWLTIEYMLTHPQGIQGLVLASTSASLPEYVREIYRLRRALPDIDAALHFHEQQGTPEHPDYKAALLRFYQQHLCRLESWPPSLVDTLSKMKQCAAYTALQGRNEFLITGTLQDWDRTARLAEIATPTLITVGGYDEMTPRCALTLQQGIAHARLCIFEQSAHLPHLEETAAYLSTVRRFLKQTDDRATT